MSIVDSVSEKLSFLKKLKPAELNKLANAKMSDIVLKELARSRKRVTALEEKNPNLAPRDLAQKLVETKKSLAGLVGGVSGVFGLASVPADLLMMVYLQLVL